MVKSREEFSAKITRGNANYPKGHPHKYKRFDDDYFSKYDRNDVADKSALVALPKVSPSITASAKSVESFDL